MEWASTLSQAPTVAQAVVEACSAIKASLGGRSVDLAVVFVHPELTGDITKVGRLIRQQLGAGVLIGCSAAGLIVQGKEEEDTVGLVLTAAYLPDVQVTGFYLEDLPNPDAPPQAWQECLGVTTPGPFILLSYGGPELPEALAGLDYAFPLSSKIGGVATGNQRFLFLNDKALVQGLVGVALRGNVIMEPLVAQGCRPLGQPHRITACEDYFLLSLDHQPPLEVLRHELSGATERERSLAQRNALFVGLLADEFNPSSQYLIRNLMGVERGALVVGQQLRTGQTIQFHIRDALTSSEDLNLGLVALANPAIRGALLFACLGRGKYFYGLPNQDVASLQRHLGGVPVGGFFCNGEIGPVGSTTYVHGYTAALGLFRPLA